MQEDKKIKRPVGRPTKYKPEYCERVIELAKEGCGWADYAAEFEVDRVSLYDWAAQHEEFSTALSRAKVLEQQWWERAGRQGMMAEKFNALVWKTSVQARFRDDYTERKATEISGPNGAPVQVQSQVIDARKLDKEKRDALRAIISAAKEGES